MAKTERSRGQVVCIRVLRATCTDERGLNFNFHSAGMIKGRGLRFIRDRPVFVCPPRGPACTWNHARARAQYAAKRGPLRARDFVTGSLDGIPNETGKVDPRGHDVPRAYSFSTMLRVIEKKVLNETLRYGR